MIKLVFSIGFKRHEIAHNDCYLQGLLIVCFRELKQSSFKRFCSEENDLIKEIIKYINSTNNYFSLYMFVHTFVFVKAILHYKMCFYML